MSNAVEEREILSHRNFFREISFFLVLNVTFKEFLSKTCESKFFVISTVY